MAVTHGDEPAWLSAHEFLRNFFDRNSLSSWELYLIEWNPEAAKEWKICLEANLNRLFRDDEHLTKKQRNSKEYKRSRELMPILASLDFFLDIHSTNNPWPVFSILKKIDDEHRHFASILPVEFYSLWWGDSIVWTTCDWVDINHGVWITIECGEHTNPQWGLVAIEAAKIFLQETGIYNFWTPYINQERCLEVLGKENVIDKESFCYKKQYINFEPLQSQEIIAEDKQRQYLAPFGKKNVIIFPTNIESIRSGAIQEAFLLGTFRENVN